MVPIEELLSSVIDEMGLTDEWLEQRKAFLEFSDKDAANLLELHDFLVTAREGFISDFYDHLLQFEETRKLIATSAIQQRLKHQQANYFDQLTLGKYDEAYVVDRLRVGAAHQRIGLNTHWYLGAYCKYLSGLLPRVLESFEGEREHVSAYVQSLLRVVFFDMGLALETYQQADRQLILALKTYAESLICNLPVGLLVLSADLEILSVNSFIDDLYDANHGELVGRRIDAALQEERLTGLARKVLDTGKVEYATPIRLSVGKEEHLIEATVMPFSITGERNLFAFDSRLADAKVMIVLQEITEKEKLRAEQIKTEVRNQTILENVADGIITIDESGNIESYNRAAEIIFGYRAGEVLGQNVNILMPLSLRKEHDQYLEDYRDTGETSCLGLGFREVEGLRKDGTVFPMELSTSEMMQGDERLFIGVVRDITKRKQAQERLDYLAHHDVLTNLPNRMLFMERLQTEIGRASRHDRRLGIAFIDLDCFKHINDTLGHDAGDCLLKVVAERFAGCLRQEDTVARLGGDEFALLLDDMRRSEDAIPAMEKIMQAMKQPFELVGREYYLTASAGVAVYPDDGMHADTLLKHADIAMYQSKNEGGNRYRFFTADMNARLVARLSLENRLRRAIDRNDFVLHYQPKVDMLSGNVVGVEALLRWNDAEQGLVMPGDFIPLMEETGMIVSAGRWVINEVCQQLRQWDEQGMMPLRVAINISGYQFRNDDLVADFNAILKEHGIGAERLELELTESVIMDDTLGVKTALKRLKDSGALISIDDFGTGYSSLAYLKRFPIDSVKIDRAFVEDLCHDADDAAIVSAIIAMSHRLNLRVIAEGVETDTQLGYLRDQGCDEIQGFLFFTPQPADQLARSLLRYNLKSTT